jgi:hypothetical protein
MVVKEHGFQHLMLEFFTVATLNGGEQDQDGDLALPGDFGGQAVILFQGVATKMPHMDVGNAGSVWNMNRPCAAKNVQSTS